MLLQMCSNRALVDSLECCMDDLVECFEDFVKKSLILIFLGIGIIVGLLCYLLKMVSERPPPLNNAIEHATRIQNKVNDLKSIKRVEQEINENMTNMLKENEFKKTDTLDNGIDEDKTRTGNKTSKVPIVPSFEENVLRDVGLLSCSKHACRGCSSTHIYIPSRVPVPSLPISSSKHKLIPCLRKRSLNKNSLPSLQISPKMLKPGSCCSMCCDDEPKMNEDVDRQTACRNKQ